jgi:hypothetical protein
MEQNLTNTIETKWIESLALDEIQMEETGIVRFNEHLFHDSILEESSINFMEHLKELFEIYASKFNNYREKDSQNKGIKFFKISNTVNDFMLYRNTLKLVVARKSVDVISLGFLSNTGGLFSARLNYQEPAQGQIHEIKAHVGAFNKVVWKFQGEPVDLEALVRHYLTEFIKHSAR